MILVMMCMMSGGKLSSEARHLTSSLTADVFSSREPVAIRDLIS